MMTLWSRLPSVMTCVQQLRTCNVVVLQLQLMFYTVAALLVLLPYYVGWSRLKCSGVNLVLRFWT